MAAPYGLLDQNTVPRISTGALSDTTIEPLFLYNCESVIKVQTLRFKNENNMKILAVANAGGHFIQLLRLRPAFEEHIISYMSSKRNFAELVPECDYHFVPDANRNSKIKLVTGFFRVLKIVYQLKPDIVITTGAALGLMSLVAGKLFGKKTIWVDSIANAGEISMSGKLASKFADKCYTQWPDLADKKFVYQGNVLL